MPAWVLALTFVGMTLLWFGLERLELRFVASGSDATGRTEVWKDSLGRMRGLWLTGGLIAFSHMTGSFLATGLGFYSMRLLK